MRKFKGNGFGFGWADYVEFDGVNLWFIFERNRPNRPNREISNRWSIQECEQFVKDGLWIEIKENRDMVASPLSTSLVDISKKDRFQLLELE